MTKTSYSRYPNDSTDRFGNPRVTNKVHRRALWMGAFEDAVLAAMPELAGRIDWDSAAHFFNGGMSATDAAARFAAQAKPIYHGFCHRFCIRPFVTRDNAIVFMVHDADFVTDDDRRNGHSSPVVAQADSLEGAKEWCDFVEAGKIVSVPHESAFVGWPELEHRVTGRPMSQILNRA